jgi:nucleotide-binding universal stress UspA family protein/hemerythrin-like domain-containing protein
MYRHLLVPVDQTELSSATVSKAVAFAGSMDARITFLHVAPDYAATEEGALQIALSPQWFAENAQGDGPAVLAKAGAAANAQGVVYDTCSRMSDRPYEVIVAVAESLNCDLIFMASHGYRGFRGLFHVSQTEKVLRHTRVPVLISTVESNDPQADCSKAIAIMEDEHRSLAVVIHGLLGITREARDAGVFFDVALIRRMMYYLHAFPERLHHPKEEEFLFKPLRARGAGIDDVLNELEVEHKRERELVTALEQSLDRYEAEEDNKKANLEAFSAVLNCLANAIWNHMGKEERYVLPAARRCLKPEDWAASTLAFEANDDPLSQISEGDFGKMFTRIANLLSSSGH